MHKFVGYKLLICVTLLSIITAFDLDIHMLADFASILFILIVHPFMYVVITYLSIIDWHTTIYNVIVVITVGLLKLAYITHASWSLFYMLLRRIMPLI